MMRVVDLRSDTVTVPTAAMRKAMHDAEVGDDVFCEDPTVNELEELSASITGKEAGLFVSSGTMGNLVSLLTHLKRGEEALAGIKSHIFEDEQGSASSLGSIVLYPLYRGRNGVLLPEEVDAAVKPEDPHMARTRLVCMENTFHGAVVPLENQLEIRKIADRHSLKMHLDGARLFNAATYLKKKPAEVAEVFDTVQFCFSKGLAAPAGSMICGPRSFIYEARRWRKAVGGGMRQVGVLAAACKLAVTEMAERLEEDHQNAALLARGIEGIEGLEINSELLMTNMVWFKISLPLVSAEDFTVAAGSEGVKVLSLGQSIRAVAHYGITSDDIKAAIDGIARAVQTLRKKSQATSPTC